MSPLLRALETGPLPRRKSLAVLLARRGGYFPTSDRANWILSSRTAGAVAGGGGGGAPGDGFGFGSFGSGPFGS